MQSNSKFAQTLHSAWAQKVIFVLLVLALLAVGYWHVFLHNSHDHSSTANASAPSQEDIQIDTQGSANVTVTYRPDLSKNEAVFDIDITSDLNNLSDYNYKSNLVLTDADINPLPNRAITLQSSSKTELKARFTSDKFPGSHFHFDVRNLGGIDDRVLHFYRKL